MFWLAVALTGLMTGLAAAILAGLLQLVQHTMWPGPGTLLDAASAAGAARHILVLLGAGVVTGVGQLVLASLSSGAGIEISSAIWFHAGRLPTARALGGAVLSIVIVGMGASLGREGAPKQAGAVAANLLCDRARLSDARRQILVACGAGAGMAAAYGVPLGGALFAIEALSGALSSRVALPAIAASLIATATSWLVLPNAATYPIPDDPAPPSLAVWAVLAGPIAGVVSVGYVRAVGWADRHKPKGYRRLVAPVVALGALGGVSIWFPQLLGNGKDISELVFLDEVPFATLLALLPLKPLATLACLSAGAPGGLFTPSLTLGALLGGVLGHAWSWAWPGAPPGEFALVGAAAVLAATTRGPISSVVLMMELTGRDRSFILPMLLGVVTATLVARAIEPRSIYEVRLTTDEARARLEGRDRV